MLMQQLKPQRIRTTGVRPGKPELIWSSRASRSWHPDFGLRRQWIETQRLYAIAQFPESTGDFICLCGQRCIARKRSLARAKRACLNHFTSHPGA